MVVILKNFEHMATRFSPIVLVLPGLTAAALGLFIWLGGLGFRRILLGVMGALTGAVAVLLVAGANGAGMVLIALLGAFVAVVFQRFFTAALLAILVGAMMFLGVAWPYLAGEQGTLAGQFSSEETGQVLSVPDSLATVRMTVFDLTDASRRAGRQVLASRWALVAAATLALLLVGLLFRHLGCALACSLLGTAMIFLGLILLLMFKGSQPVMRIEARAPFFGVVFLAMVAFGTVEQWVLCRRAERQTPAGGEKGRSRKEPGKRPWRDR